MKTLDEVITKYELCKSKITCFDCPYVQEVCSCDSDALHYLKEYRAKKEDYIDASNRHYQAANILENRMEKK